MKVFLDLGAHRGQSIKYVRQNISNDCKIISFEPLPENIEHLKKMQKVWNFELIEKAVSTYDGVTKFYTGMTESGSIFKEKRTGKLDGKTHVIVETIDFPEWFSVFYRPNMDVSIKMNIEGAEYDIIDRMVQFHLDKFVNNWYVQWHWNKIGMARSEHDSISSLIDWEPWEVM